MCGIIGFSSSCLDFNSKAMICAMSEESKIRGKHAYGISWQGCDSGTFKSHRLAEVKEKIFSLPEGRIDLIFHNRYSTSGDWFSHSNNQPIAIEGKALAFNGVIDMRSPESWEEIYGFQPETCNDGEIFLRRLSTPASAETFLRSIKCTFAGVFLMDGKCFAIRNEKRPAWHFKMGDSNYVASTKDIVLRALTKVGIATELAEHSKEIEPFKLMEISS